MYRVFVYGTLLKGLERDFCLQNSKRLGSGHIRAKLYDLGEYPGIKPGNRIVRGVLYLVSEETLKLLDQIEGYHEHTPQKSLFIRRFVHVTLDNGGHTQAYCYYYAGPVDQAPIIESGDYLLYRKKNEPT